jgi:hypothetical protein
MIRDAEPGDIVMIGVQSYTVIDYNPDEKLAALSTGNKWRFTKLRKCLWVRNDPDSVEYKQQQLYKTFGKNWWIGAKIDQIIVS